MPQRSATTNAQRVALVYRFAAFELDPERYQLRRSGRTLPIATKSFDVLHYLVRNRERPVSRKELLEALWPEVRVAAGSLTQAIWNIREVVRGASDEPSLIKTVRGTGYRFVAPVLTASADAAEAAAARVPTEPLQERLSVLPDDVRALVLALATELAQQHTTVPPCASCQHRPFQ